MPRSTSVRWVCRLAAIVALGPVLDASAQIVKPSPKLPGLGGATVEITRATASPTEAAPGDALQVTATVRSSGGPSGPFAVLLKLDAGELGRQSGDLGSGAERPFTFQTTAPDRTGPVCYDLGLEGETGNKATMKSGSQACLRVTPRLASTPGADPKATPKLRRPESAETDPKGAPKSLAPGAIALKLDGSGSPQETERRFKALPDNARVQLKDGRTLTKRELVAESAQKREEALARLKKSGGGGGSNFAALKAQHAAKQDAELAKARGQVEAQIRQLGAHPSDAEQEAVLKELEAVRTEARQLRARQASASATEKAQIDARAEVLMTRAKQLLGQ